MFYIGIEGAGGIDIMSKLSKKVSVCYWMATEASVSYMVCIRAFNRPSHWKVIRLN